MGDRAVISNKNKKLGVYLHWNGNREFVESVLAYCDAKKYRCPDVDDEYGWARLCQVAGNTIGGTLSLGVGVFKDMDTDNWDNGTYIIKDWDIVERLYANYPDMKMQDSMFENLMYINNKQPEKERLSEEELEAFAKLWEVRHIDRLNEERKAEVEKYIKEEKERQAQMQLQTMDEKENIEQDDTKIEKNGLIMTKGEFLKMFADDYESDVQKPTDNNLKEEVTPYTEKEVEDIGR